MTTPTLRYRGVEGESPTTAPAGKEENAPVSK
jgi:hypothetical protein